MPEIAHGRSKSLVDAGMPAVLGDRSVHPTRGLFCRVPQRGYPLPRSPRSRSSTHVYSRAILCVTGTERRTSGSTSKV